MRASIARGSGIAALFVCGVLTARAADSGRRTLVFDDYYQKRRPESGFTQGVPLHDADRALSNFYSPGANAIPNGTFALAGLIRDKFDTETSDQPIGEQLLKHADAYLLICPIKAAAGGRANLSDREADVLEAYVARGGMLGLVLNSMPSDPGASDFDFEGMNRVARRFGLEFLSEETKTVLIPVMPDHPLFDGVRGVIYGNGTTIRALPAADPRRIVLLRDPRPGAHDPVGVITPHGAGKVLLFGDSGTLGNAHAFRSDTDQAAALREMIYGLLPDGPLPAYGWRQGTRLRVHLRQEQIFSCYPEGNRLFALPKAGGTEVIASGVRALDLAAAPDRKSAANPGRYASAISRREASFLLAVGASDGRAFVAQWRSSAGNVCPMRILPKGTVVDASLPSGSDLSDWQWALDNEIICAPLKPYVQPGEASQAMAFAPLPHAQLVPVPTLAEAPATFRFEGETSFRGKSCFLLTRAVFLTAAHWRPQDFVSADCLSACGPGQIELSAGGLYALTKFWIGRDSLLPVHTEMSVSSSLWWKDVKFPAAYSGTHDWKNYENWAEISFVGTFGRTLTADFEPEATP